MTITEPLKNETEGYRKLLAQWVEFAEPWSDYVADQQGNRIYSREKTEAYVQPILQSMGLSGRGYTMWRLSAFTQIYPPPRSELYFVLVNMVSGRPLMMQGDRHNMVVPGWYTMTLAPFDLTPEFDCLFIGDVTKARQSM